MSKHTQRRSGSLSAGKRLAQGSEKEPMIDTVPLSEQITETMAKASAAVVAAAEFPKGRVSKSARRHVRSHAAQRSLLALCSGGIDSGTQAIHDFFDMLLTGGVDLVLEVYSYFRLTRRRIRRALHEKRVHRFPESDSWPVQLILLLSGLLPMLTGNIRARLWRLRRRSIDFFSQHQERWIPKKVHPGIFIGSATAVASLALFFTMYTFGTTVEYNGQTIATASSKSVVEEACTDLEQITSRTLGASYSIDSQMLRFTSGIVSRDNVVDAEVLEVELSDQIGLVSAGYALYVEGEMVGATTYEGALEELLEQLKAAERDEDTISCDFKEAVEIRQEYVPNDKIMNLGHLAETLYSTKYGEETYTVASGDVWSQIANDHGLTSQELLALNPGYDIDKLSIGEVLTISNAVPYLTITVTQRERYVENIPFEIEYQDTNTLYQGDYKVLSAGSYGAADVVANVTYTNGEESQRDILSYVRLSNPATEVQARGTLERPTWIATGNFRWPCSGNITSRYGYRNLSYSKASRNHKGIDIANRYGTSIGAADGGTVIYAGWMSGYGYLVQIDHGNGYVTYYGHNSSLLVSRGDKVYKGQQIARMGSTGNSTGNHCHFEIRYNGVDKNPLSYLP